MLLTSLSLHARPHKRHEVLCVVDDIVTRMRIAPGCTRTRLLADTEDPNAFDVTAEWRTQADAEDFFRSREGQLFKGIRMLLRDDPIVVLDTVSGRTTRLIRGL